MYVVSYGTDLYILIPVLLLRVDLKVAPMIYFISFKFINLLWFHCIKIS